MTIANKINPMDDLLAARLREEAQHSFTVPEFCAIERMSETTYRKLKKMNLGPDEVRFEGMSFVRITSRARSEWHAKLEGHRQQNAEKLERERAKRSEIAARGPAKLKARRQAA